ncbi:MAG TPA: thioredoxin domain-containing protein [Candidatus Methylomirabilis sp.]|nr:thioredoxin domain-containing protein [Candidatus Methylomirabilis sp.]
MAPPSSRTARLAFLALLYGLLAFPPAYAQQTSGQSAPSAGAKSPSTGQPAVAETRSEMEELQSSIDRAGNDRAALVRNLEEFLKKYPDSRERPRIYRALAEASLQLRDTPRATDYAERIVALAPDDMSMTLLAIQLLGRSGDEPSLRRAVNYSTRVLAYIERSATLEKSPKISKEEWETEQKRDRTNLLSLRGALYFKLRDNVDAEKDFRASMALKPSAAAGEKLGEIAELNKDLAGAIREYARAFVLSDAASTMAARREIRQKLGNVWRLAHGSDQGLGDYLLQSYDDAIVAADAPKPKRNDSAKDAYDFTLRKLPEGLPYPLSSQKGKIAVLNFWATWCGPCRALEPHFERVAAQFQGSPEVVFIAVNCDEDESLVPGYLEEVKPHTTVVFADGLDRLFGVKVFPTIVVLDRSGKIGYRSEGFDSEQVEAELANSIRRLLTAPAEHP